ncbi:hypothetical protein [Frateuria sp. YIM B11624]|uniref:hypothetical protein n=1 Tax=Frateuria sp. YIM B11624 TaxID=3143185 RepID=UPI003C70B0DB
MPSTKSELLVVLTAAAGLPMNLDQIMEQLSVGTDRAEVDALCRAMKDQGQLVASIEDGRVAYALAEPAPASATISHLHDRRVSDRETTIAKVRRLLEKATAPMTPVEVQAALPEETLDKVLRALHLGERRGDFQATRDGAHAEAYAPKGGIAIAIAAPAPGEPPAAAPDPAVEPTTEGPRSAVRRKAEAALHKAEQARDAYLQSIVAIKPVWDALEANVTACREALEAMRDE